MPDRAKKKQIQRLKREKKRARHHKLANLSPFKKVEMFSDVSACYVNSDWRERGQAIGYVVREMRDGSMAILSFLIDLWCAGLKNIWARFDVYADEVNGTVKRTSEDMDATMVRVSVDEMRRLLASSIRFARQNGFRLPPDWQKCISFVGPFEDIDQAPLDGFGWEGDPSKLRWVAPLHDLRSRLVGCTAEEFLRRPNVDYIMEVGSTVDLTEDDSDADEQIEREMATADLISAIGARLASDWLHQQGEIPHRRLRDAATAQYCRTILAGMNPVKDEYKPRERAAMGLLYHDVFDSEIPSDGVIRGEINEAIAQFDRWIASFPDKNGSLHAIFETLRQSSQLKLSSPG